MRNPLATLLAIAIWCAMPVVANASPESDYLKRLDQLVDDYGFDVGEKPTFDEPGFNRLLGKARRALERAVIYAENGRLSESSYWLARSVQLDDRATEYGDSKGMSGTGFSDDLASFGTFITGKLQSDLLDELTFDPSVPEWIIDYLEDLSDSAYDASREGNHTSAAYIYSWGIVLSEWLLD